MKYLLRVSIIFIVFFLHFNILTSQSSRGTIHVIVLLSSHYWRPYIVFLHHSAVQMTWMTPIQSHSCSNPLLVGGWLALSQAGSRLESINICFLFWISLSPFDEWHCVCDRSINNGIMCFSMSVCVQILYTSKFSFCRIVTFWWQSRWKNHFSVKNCSVLMENLSKTLFWLIQEADILIIFQNYDKRFELKSEWAS